MKLHHPFLLVAMLLGTPAAHAQAANFLPRDWTLRDGSTTNGRFVRIDEENLIIKKDDREFPISRESLSAADWEVAWDIGRREKDGLVEASKRMKFEFVSPVELPNSSFDMGAPENAFARQAEEPHHLVKISRGFWLKRTEVTWAEWNLVRELAFGRGYDLSVGRNGYQGDAAGNHPVTEVSWWDAALWCNLKSEAENLKPVYYSTNDFAEESILRDKKQRKIFMDRGANGYRLPTEAEWELAWHLGAKTAPEKFGGWNRLTSSGNTHEVGTAQGTETLRFHDMLGNVAEWCWDWQGPVGPGPDPVGPPDGKFRIFRGGSWADPPWCCYPSYRGDFSPKIPQSFFVGFRPARNPSK